MWAGGCHICRIRDRRKRTHDWRDCPEHPEDRAAVRQAHEEVAIGKGLLSNTGQIGGSFCKCRRMKETCWIQLRYETKSGSYKCYTVATEVVAAIKGIGPTLFRGWEEREGGARGHR